MIFFDGCSYTFGDELENPEKDAFPHLVARMGLMREGITRDYVNLGQRGKSNDGILRTTLEFCEKNEVDIAVIQFTKFSRREIKKPQSTGYFHLTATDNDERSLEYYKHLHNRDDDVANYHKNKFLLENYFKKRNISYFFLCLQKMHKVEGYTPSSWYHLVDKKPILNLRELLGGKRWHPENYLVGHPSKKGHRMIANNIYENIF